MRRILRSLGPIPVPTFGASLASPLLASPAPAGRPGPGPCEPAADTVRWKPAGRGRCHTTQLATPCSGMPGTRAGRGPGVCACAVASQAAASAAVVGVSVHDVLGPLADRHRLRVCAGLVVLRVEVHPVSFALSLDASAFL